MRGIFWSTWRGILVAAASVLVLGAAGGGTGTAFANGPHTAPQGPAPAKFAADVPPVVDHEWNFRVGGFGGVRRGAPLRHIPVIFVHGNNVDGGDWYPVRDDFRAAGWSDQELWALSYNGLGGQNGSALSRTNPERDADHASGDGVTRVTDDASNVPDVYAFFRMVQAYTGSEKFTLVGHSLGVTLARETLRQHPELRAYLVAFVGIAGANHGTTFCPPGSETTVVSCDEIAAGTPWLARLNAAGEAYGPARWLMVEDGTGAGDPAYVGPTYAHSPELAGADLHAFPNTYHNDLRIDAPIVADYRGWLEAAERPSLSTLAGAARAQPTASAAGAAPATPASGAAQPARPAGSHGASSGPRKRQRVTSAAPRQPARTLAYTGGPTGVATLGLLLAGVALLGRRGQPAAASHDPPGSTDATVASTR